MLILDGKHDGPTNTIIREAKKKRIIIDFTSKTILDSMCDEKKHQGVIAYVAPYEYSSVEDILDKASARLEDPFVIILDEIEDPHNLGAIIRTANLCGAHGVIIPERRAAALPPRLWTRSRPRFFPVPGKNCWNCAGLSCA